MTVVTFNQRAPMIFQIKKSRMCKFGDEIPVGLCINVPFHTITLYKMTVEQYKNILIFQETTILNIYIY